jgi:hypothetical protein
VRHSKNGNTRNVLMRDGSVRRVGRETAELLISNGQGVQYVSNTVFRAISLGLEVEDPSTRDEDGALLEQVRAAHERSLKKRKKEDRRREREERELFDL